MNGMPLRAAQAACVCLSGMLLLCGCGSAKSATGANGPGNEAELDAAARSRANLARGLDMARESLEKVRKIKGYTFTFIKQERVKDQLLPAETMEMKFRAEPYSLYAKHLRPNELRGQEAIYVKGKYGDRIVAHGAGPIKGLVTVAIALDSPLAMANNRHSITHAGLENLLHQLLELSEREKDYLDRCDIRFIEGQTVDGRPCHCLEIVSPRPSPTFRMARARIYMDKEWIVPVKYEAYEFPPNDDRGEPILVESYTYTKLKLNVELTDADFDPANPKYAFPRIGRP